MATYEQLRDAIVARIASVPDVGVVNDFRRGVTTYEEFARAFTTSIAGQSVLRGWTVAWEAGVLTPDGWQADGRMRLRGPATYVVRGYAGVNDAAASERDFSALVRAVMLALATCQAALTPRLSHVPVTLRQHTFLTWDVPGLGAVLAHHAEIAVEVQVEEVV